MWINNFSSLFHLSEKLLFYSMKEKMCVASAENIFSTPRKSYCALRHDLVWRLFTFINFYLICTYNVCYYSWRFFCELIRNLRRFYRLNLSGCKFGVFFTIIYLVIFINKKITSDFTADSAKFLSVFSVKLFFVFHLLRSCAFLCFYFESLVTFIFTENHVSSFDVTSFLLIIFSRGL